MHVKGNAFLGRKNILIEEVGEVRFAALLADVAKREPIFNEPIHAGTLIPMRSFVAFADALVDTFYGGDRRMFIRFGEQVAEYTLILGPQKRIRDTNSVSIFMENARFIYRSYFTDGRAEGSCNGETADVRVLGVPPDDACLYLEYTIAGYMRRGLELVGLHGVSMICIRGFSRGDSDVHYRYCIESTPSPGPFSVRRSP